MIATRKELNQRAKDYIAKRISEGYKIRCNNNDNACRDQSIVLEKKIGKGEVWYEWIHYGLDESGDFVFTAEITLNGKRQNFIRWKYFHAYDKTFSSTKEEAEALL